MLTFAMSIFKLLSERFLVLHSLNVWFQIYETLCISIAKNVLNKSILFIKSSQTSSQNYI